MKKKIFFIGGILLCMGIVVFAVIQSMGRKPFKNLDTAEIQSAKVFLSPPDVTIEINDIEELVRYLKDVVIYNEDNSYSEYVGQGVTFTILKTDGTQLEVCAYNPFLIIDGVGYRTKYAPCEALNAYGNKLREK